MEEVNVKIGKKDYTFRFKKYYGELKDDELVCHSCCLSKIYTKLPDPDKPGDKNYYINDFCLRHGETVDLNLLTLSSGLYKYIEDMRPELIKDIMNG